MSAFPAAGRWREHSLEQASAGAAGRHLETARQWRGRRNFWLSGPFPSTAGCLAKPCSLSGVSRQPSIHSGGAPLEARGLGSAEQGYTHLPEAEM